MDEKEKVDEVYMLQKLLIWKRRLYSDQLSVMSFENFEEICDFRLFTAFDSPSRRSLLFIVEKLVSFCWHSSQFGRHQLYHPLCDFISTLLKILRDVSPSIMFDSRDCWFGGISSQSSTLKPKTATAFVSICIHVAALSTKSCDKRSLSSFLTTLTRFVDSCCGLSSALIENDERCLSTAVAFFHIKSANINLPNVFDPWSLFCCILQQIDFDHCVILDWLHSEAVTVPFLFRFLNGFTSVSDIIHCSSLHTPTKSCCVRKMHRFELISAPVDCSNPISLQLRQLHGDRVVNSEFCFSTNDKSARLVESSRSAAECKVDLIFSCFSRLCTSFEQLSSNDLAPFNLKPLITALQRVNSMLRGVVLSAPKT